MSNGKEKKQPGTGAVGTTLLDQPSGTQTQSATQSVTQSTAQAPATIQSGGAVGTVATGIDYAADAGIGREDFGKEDLLIPFLVILQASSPFCKKSDPKYIQGAEEGKLINTVTRKIIDPGEGVYAVQAFYERKHVEWRSGEEKGFVAAHDISERLLTKCHRNDKNRDILPNGNELIDTAYHFILLLEPETGDFTPVVITMSRTQLKVSKRWNSMLSEKRLTLTDGKKILPATYASVYKLTTVGESKDEYSWMNWNVEFHDWLKDPTIYEAAKAFRESIVSGIAKMAEPVVVDAEESTTEMQVANVGKNNGNNQTPF